MHRQTCEECGSEDIVEKLNSGTVVCEGCGLVQRGGILVSGPTFAKQGEANL